MTDRKAFVHAVFERAQLPLSIQTEAAQSFCPANIALIKYWGKRCPALNLPLVSSLSYTFRGPYGTTTSLKMSDTDDFFLNGIKLDPQDNMFLGIREFLDLFRDPSQKFFLSTYNSIPTSAGIASSASGFACLVEVLDQLYGWQLKPHQKSLLARIGSGSACRSFWPGLVFWEKGRDPMGLDSYAFPLQASVVFEMAVVVLEEGKKKRSSRGAMTDTLLNPSQKNRWVQQQKEDLNACLSVLKTGQFKKLGQVVQRHAVFFHQWLVDNGCRYDLKSSCLLKKKILLWQEEGLCVYFTQDAGPNLKLLFLPQDRAEVLSVLDQEGYTYFCV
jgi:diphosphomevalonate decarboxylase